MKGWRGARLLLMTAVASFLFLAPTACSAPEEMAKSDRQQALALTLPDLEISVYHGAEQLGGHTVRLSDVLTYGKPIVLNFWAALCPPCRVEMATLQIIHNLRGHEVLVLGLDIGPQQFLGTREQGRQLLAESGARYPVGTTFNESVVRDYQILGMPTTYFIEANGNLLRRWSGLLTTEKLNELVDELVGV